MQHAIPVHYAAGSQKDKMGTPIINPKATSSESSFKFDDQNNYHENHEREAKKLPCHRSTAGSLKLLQTGHGVAQKA